MPNLNTCYDEKIKTKINYQTIGMGTSDVTVFSVKKYSNFSCDCLLSIRVKNLKGMMPLVLLTDMGIISDWVLKLWF